MFQLKPKEGKFLHPTRGWLNEVETIRYFTSINKSYPYEVSSWILLFNKELKEALEENQKIKSK